MSQIFNNCILWYIRVTTRRRRAIQASPIKAFSFPHLLFDFYSDGTLSTFTLRIPVHLVEFAECIAKSDFASEMIELQKTDRLPPHTVESIDISEDCMLREVRFESGSTVNLKKTAVENQFCFEPNTLLTHAEFVALFSIVYNWWFTIETFGNEVVASNDA